MHGRLRCSALAHKITAFDDDGSAKRDLLNGFIELVGSQKLTVVQIQHQAAFLQVEDLALVVFGDDQNALAFQSIELVLGLIEIRAFIFDPNFWMGIQIGAQLSTHRTVVKINDGHWDFQYFFVLIN